MEQEPGGKHAQHTAEDAQDEVRNHLSQQQLSSADGRYEPGLEPAALPLASHDQRRQQGAIERDDEDD